MNIQVGQECKALYGSGFGVVAKVNAKSVIVTVDGQNYKVSMSSFLILNRDDVDPNNVADPIHY